MVALPGICCTLPGGTCAVATTCLRPGESCCLEGGGCQSEVMPAFRSVGDELPGNPGPHGATEAIPVCGGEALELGCSIKFVGTHPVGRGVVIRDRCVEQHRPPQRACCAPRFSGLLPVAVVLVAGGAAFQGGDFELSRWIDRCGSLAVRTHGAGGGERGGDVECRSSTGYGPGRLREEPLHVVWRQFRVLLEEECDRACHLGC